MNVAQWEFTHVARYGDATAIDLESASWTNRQLHDQAQRLASAIISEGVKPGARVALILPNSRELFVASSAVLMSGCVLVVLPATATPEELSAMLAHCEPEVVVSDLARACHTQSCSGTRLRVITGSGETNRAGFGNFDHLIERNSPLECPVPRAGSDPAQLCYTSGSTGHPKAVVYTHEGIDGFWKESAAVTVDPDVQRTFLLAVPPTAYASRFLGYRFTANWRYVVLPVFDAQRVLAAIANCGVQNISLVPTMAEQLVAVSSNHEYDCSSLREVSIGGAHVSTRLIESLRRCFRSPDLSITVRYGMTETGGWIASTKTGGDGAVGRVRAGTIVRVVDSQGHELPPGRVGEVIVRSPFAAVGYWNDVEQTAAVFRSGFVHTGDLGALGENGELRICGRIKDVIIQGGFKITPQEVAAVVMDVPGVSDCAVVGVPDELLGEAMVACVVRGEAAGLSVADIRSHCRMRLERRKQPTRILLLDSLPQTTTGKVDLSRIREIVEELHESSTQSEDSSRLDGLQPLPRRHEVKAIVERELSSLLSEVGGRKSPVTVDMRQATFGERGLDSIAAVRLASRLRAILEVALSPTAIYSNPTVDTLTDFVCSEKWPPTKSQVPPLQPDTENAAAVAEGIAIVGLGCRLPGGVNSPIEFWELLCSERDVLCEAPAARRWASSSTHRAAFLDHAERFDARFFGLESHAAYLDPRHRMVLEVSWEALEDSGFDPLALTSARTGVFLGIYGNRYDSPDPLATAPSMAVSYLCQFLNIRGPVLSVDTSCSSSLVALHCAVRSLGDRECDLAIVGGVTLISEALFSDPLGVLSPGGRSRAFDEGADGFGAGEGCVLFILKRLEDARRAGDRIYARVLGTAVNHDGRSSSVTAPNPTAQEALINAALQRAGVKANAVQYIEAHGTGTRLGDPIEVEAIARVFAGREAPALAIGSVKTNIGHLEAAAGAAGLAKVALAIAHRHLPASLHCSSPNPHIPWNDIPVRVQSRPGPWPSPRGPLVAGVSSFGMSGTNAHAVVGEAPYSSVPGADEAHVLEVQEEAWLLLLSASTPKTLRATAERWAKFIEQNGNDTCRDLAYSSSCRRAHLPYRLAVPGRTRADWTKVLRQFVSQPNDINILPARDSRTRLVMVFSGQGAQWDGMGRQLFATQPIFRDALQRCASLIDGYFPWRLLDELWRAAPQSRLDQTEIAQPALFSLQVALYELWRSWGVEPDAVLGHSLGEVAAAFACGALALPDAVRLVCARARTMADLPRTGAMIAVTLREEEVAAVCSRFPHALSVAARNSPGITVLSGASETVEVVADELASRGKSFRRLAGTYAFHSQHLDPLSRRMASTLHDLQTCSPNIPMRSTLTGEEVSELGAAYWARQMRETVDFVKASSAFMKQGYELFLEIGPDPVLLASLKETAQSIHVDKETVMLSGLKRGVGELDSMLSALGRLHCSGFRVNWSRRYAVPGKSCSLPPLEWDRSSFWYVSTAGQHSLTGSVDFRRDLPRGDEDSVIPDDSAECLPRDHLLGWISRRTDTSATDLPRDSTLDALGVDSLEMIRLRSQIEDRFGLRISPLQWSPLLTVSQALALLSGTARIKAASLGSTRESAIHWLNATGNGPTIVWVHPVAGGVMCYRPLAELLQCRSLAVQRTDAPDGSVNVKTVQELAQEYLEVIAGEADPSTVVLAGWSFGASVAYEMAVLGTGAAVARNPVIMIDAPVLKASNATPPQYINCPGANQVPGPRTPDWRVIVQAFFREIAGTQNTATLDSWLNQALNAAPDMTTLLASAQKSGVLRDIAPRDAHRVLRVFLSNVSALHAYRPSLYKGRVAFIRAARARGASDCIWNRFASALHLTLLDGDHFSIMQQPLLERLAQVLRTTISEIPAIAPAVHEIKDRHSGSV